MSDITPNELMELEDQNNPSVSKSNFSAGLDPVLVAKAIDDEPELEGEMPDGIWETIKTKKDLQAYSVMLVHLTKKAIKERLGV